MSNANISEGHFHHVILFWLKNPGDTESRKTVIETTKSFADIPGVISVSAGLAVQSERGAVDGSYDVGTAIVFENEAAFHAYEKHPLHVAAAKHFALVEKVVVYDYIDLCQ